MTRMAMIATDGVVTALEDLDFAAACRRLLGPVDIFSCQPILDAPDPFPTFARPLVAACHEWAYQTTPICNPKAWSLYGRSPIAGPVIIAHDVEAGDRPRLAPYFLERLASDYLDIPGLLNLDHMRYLATRAGLTWPTIREGVGLQPR